MSDKRGATIATNDNGTLERVDGSNTFIGTATMDDGKVVTKRFRGTIQEKEKVVESWEQWQGKKKSSEESITRSKNAMLCPITMMDCTPKCRMWSTHNKACSIYLGGIGLYNISTNLPGMDISDQLELLALALGDLKSTGSSGTTVKTTGESNGVEAYLADKSFLSFVNLHSKTVYGPYKKFCEENGYSPLIESEFVRIVADRYDELETKGVPGGRVFQAR